MRIVLVWGLGRVLFQVPCDLGGIVFREGRESDWGSKETSTRFELLSKLLVSPLITPIVVPRINPPYIPPLRSVDYSSFRV